MAISSSLHLHTGDLTALAHALAAAIWRKRDIERIAGQAGIPRAYVDFDGNAQTMWDEVLNQAQKRPAKTFSAVLALAVDQVPSLHHAEVVASWRARLGRGESGV
uniref:effector-associated domain EAD1-containing protein n=1 Tax=Arthrobacter sp. TaxID=1667 RepID=UPI00159EDBB0|nr:effector-associated domain EAD1-containing protein [Arthrobacter sp.]